MPLTGDTIRLKGEFRDFDGQLADPDEAGLTIYDGSHRDLEVLIPEKSSVGKYYYDYTIPTDRTGVIYFEFKGVLGGRPIVGRAAFVSEWVRGFAE